MQFPYKRYGRNENGGVREDVESSDGDVDISDTVAVPRDLRVPNFCKWLTAKQNRKDQTHTVTNHQCHETIAKESKPAVYAEETKVQE